MHAEIELVQRKVLDLFDRQRAYLKCKPSEFLEDLLHRSRDEMTTGSTFTLRTAAQINHAATTLIMEERNSTGGSRGSRGL